MRILGRDDTRLVLGLIIGGVVVFARPIGHLLDIARDVERTYGLALIPGLIILVVAFMFHVQEKRQGMKAEAFAASEAVRQAEERSQELEGLVAFANALTRALDLEAVREVVLQHLSHLARHDEVWVLVRNGVHWERLVGTAGEGHADRARLREALADQASVHVDGREPAPDGVRLQDHVCFSMIAGGDVVGMIGVPEGSAPMTDALRRMIAAAAALVAVSVKNAQLFREIRDNSLRDGLTGLFNRAHGLEMIDHELRRAHRSKQPLAVIMFDIDHFKDVNDRHGHLCGDAVLSAVGRRLKEVLRTSDLKCRYGGEEFLVLLPETTFEGARQVADSLRSELAKTPVNWGAETVPITASFGLAAAQPNEVDPAALVGRADAALYRAKHDGRNCVRVAADAVLV